MLHHVLTFTKAEDFAQAVAKFGAFKGVDLQITINSTTNTMRIYSKAETDQALIEAFMVDCSNADLDFDLHHEEVSTTADLLDEINKLQNENAKLQNELTNLQKCNDLHTSVYKSMSKELDRYKAAVSLFREQLNLVFPKQQ